MLGAALVVLATAGGCGESDSSASGDEVVVETGSLSKAEFIKQADEACQSARAHFTREYKAFAARVLAESKPDEDKVQRELVDTILVPNFEKGVKEISALGAPKGDEQPVTEFLNALDQRLDELHEKPSELSNTMFARPAKTAKAYGLAGCVESLIG